MLQQSSPIVIHRRRASDSFDFNVRHGRALQGQAARECWEMLLALFGASSRVGAAHRTPWETVWPVAEPGGRDRP